MNPLMNILKLSAWDFFAKIAYFLAFIFLARTLGVNSYGVLEFAISLMTYFFLLAEGGLEVWATREAAKTEDIQALVKTVLPLRFLLAGFTFLLLLGLLGVFPDFPSLSQIIVLFGLSLFIQVWNLKWVFMGKEQMSVVGKGLAFSQLLFAVGVVFVIRSPSDLYWVPLMKILGDISMVGYFGYRFVKLYGGFPFIFPIRVQPAIMRPAFVMGGSQGLGLLNYNFDTLLIGYLMGALSVGMYNVAYRPVTVVLAVPLTYFLGLFPVLSRLHKENIHEYGQMVKRSVELAAVVALPLGISGFFFSEEIIVFLFGENYSDSSFALQILIWSAVLVVLRGPYRQALNAAGKQGVDFRCAAISTFTNITLNLALIPFFGIRGAAAATVTGDLVWFIIACGAFHRFMKNMSVLHFVVKPVFACIIMIGVLLSLTSFHWFLQACGGMGAYVMTLAILDPEKIPGWCEFRRTPFFK